MKRLNLILGKKQLVIASLTLLLGAAAAGGLYGVGLALSLTLVLLCRMSSCGVPYLINLVPRVETDSEDAWLRVPWYRMKYDRFSFFRTAGRKRP